MLGERWLDRAVARGRLLGRVRLWYHPEYAPFQLARTARVEGLDPKRGERILMRLVEEKLIEPRHVSRAPIAAVGDLLRFHPLAYLESTADRERLGRIFGLPPDEVDVDALLRAQRRAVGGTIAAATAAVRRPGMVAINLGGGLHHAEPEIGSGFCVYNDVGVAIAKLRHRGFDRPIAIVDLDYHQGNGNTVAFAEDPSVYVFSIHGAVWSHASLSGGSEIHLSGAVDDARYLARLRTLLLPVLRRVSPGLIFYVAGNDVLAGDLLGQFSLSPEGVLARDVHVLEAARALSASLVVTLGGGYSPRAWHSTTSMIRYALTGRRAIDAPRSPDLSLRFERIARVIDPLDLTADDEFDLSEEDVMAALTHQPAQRRILGYYSAQGVEFALERYGILPEIRKRGWTELVVEGDPKDPAHQLVRVRGRKRLRDPLSLLVELVVRRAFVEIPFPEGTDRVEVLHVEWLLLQDPSRSFTLGRPPLPGQVYPGLGIAMQMQALLTQAVKRLGLAALSDNPAHFHNAAALTSSSFFLDPEVEGRFRAMLEVLSELAPADASFAVEEKRLRYGDDTPCEWEAAMHLHPVEPWVDAYFRSAPYIAQVVEAQAAALRRGLHLVSPR